MRRETRDEQRHETFRIWRLFVSRLTSILSRLVSHVSCPWAIASLLLVGLVWALFAQTGNFEYLNLDDPNYTFNCAFVKDGLSWANVREAFRRLAYEGIWMPVTSISYMCTISWLGSGAGAHHLVNVAIHALNAVLLLWLLVALGQRASCSGILPVAAAFLLSAFWALHPQRVEAVAWIASRKELLCTMFILGGLLCWLRARRREGWGWIPALAGVYACFALASMSKPTAMCFPFLVLAVEGMMVSGDVRHATCDMRKATFSIFRSPFFILHFSFFIVIAAATGALAVYSQTHAEGHAGLALFSAPLGWRILNAMVAVGLYIFQMFIPVGIHLDYRSVPEKWPIDGAIGLVVLALAALGIVGVWWWLCRRARRRTGQEEESDHSALFLLGGAILWFFSSLGPTLGIFGSFGDHARADRFLYLPAMALPIAGMMLCRWKLGRDRHDTPVADARQRVPPTGTTGIVPVAGMAGLAVVVAGLFAIAYPIVASYRTDLAAFTHTLAVDPDNWRALRHLGQARCAKGLPLQFQGKPEGVGALDAGIDMLRHSYAVKASDDTAVKLVFALMWRGRAGDWDEILDVCAKFDPASDRSGMALEALGTAELIKRRWADADRHLRYLIYAKDQNQRYLYSSRYDEHLRYDAELKFAYVLHHQGQYDAAKKRFIWISNKSMLCGRPDLERRAGEFLKMIQKYPRSLLSW